MSKDREWKKSNKCTKENIYIFSECETYNCNMQSLC